MVEDDTLPLYLKSTESLNSTRKKVMLNIYKKFIIYGFLVVLLIFISYIAICELLILCNENSTSVDNSYEHFPSYNLVSSLKSNY